MAPYLVRPYAPDASYLFRKLDGTHLDPEVGGEGERMPRVEAPGEYLSPNSLRLVRAPRASLGAAAQEIQGEVFEETNSSRRYQILFAADTKPSPDYPQAKVPDGVCFVLGDNRNSSSDSRTMGFVALGDVLGEVQYRYWPAATWARFGDMTE